MRIGELIRCIEETAPYDALLCFYDTSDSSFSTGQAQYIAGGVTEVPGLLKPIRIVLDFQVADGGVALRRQDVLSWLRGLSESYGQGMKALIRLHGNFGKGPGSKELLGDEMWSRIEHEADGRYALSDPVEPHQFEFDDGYWRKVAYYGGSFS